MGVLLDPAVATWHMAQDHDYAPGALILFALVLVAYLIGAVVALGAVGSLSGRFREGFRAGLRDSRG